MEEWKDIVGYEDLYMISSHGKIWSKKRSKIRVNDISHRGYVLITLSKENIDKAFSVHRLVAQHFICNDDPINKIFVDHKNRITTDNNVENLRWVTPTENNFNRRVKGYIGYNKKTDNYRLAIGRKGHIGTFKTYEEANAKRIELITELNKLKF